MKFNRKILLFVLIAAVWVSAMSLAACNKAKKVEVALDYGFRPVALEYEADTESKTQANAENIQIEVDPDALSPDYKKLDSVTVEDEGFGDGALLTTRQYYLRVKVTFSAKDDNIADKLNVVFKIKNDFKVFDCILLEGTSGVTLTEQSEEKDARVFSHPLTVQDSTDAAAISKYFLFKLKPQELYNGSGNTNQSTSEGLNFDIKCSGEKLRLSGSGADGLTFSPDVDKGRLDAPKISIPGYDPEHPNLAYTTFEFTNVKYSNFYIINVAGSAYATITKEPKTEKLILHYVNWTEEGTKPTDAPDSWVTHGSALLVETNPSTITLQLFPGSRIYKISVDAGENSDIYDGNASVPVSINGAGKTKLATPVLTAQNNRLYIAMISHATVNKLYLYPSDAPQRLLFTLTSSDSSGIATIVYPEGEKPASYPGQWPAQNGTIENFTDYAAFALLPGENTYMLIVEGLASDYIASQSALTAFEGVS